jgi:hypothetical protein
MGRKPIDTLRLLGRGRGLLATSGRHVRLVAAAVRDVLEVVRAGDLELSAGSTVGPRAGGDGVDLGALDPAEDARHVLLLRRLGRSVQRDLARVE